ncbi:hypothetical protein BU23DRAFT_94181 [Bimuria novae-zelandiae CBS 107.79]|uniref:Sensor histidine kinase-like protein/response regulator n=1 Tax=Bimuria novae-zelandiae CBS 107.79 TaxID=1447943 RepID=A0A6A5VBG0_9PLEO|nr:hypothetical protein BU23DRAFT_94181 [Bimuria novae-zelandiae CBS 107.79]
MSNQKPEVAERRRERDVFLLYGSAFRDLPKIEQPSGQVHNPRASTDSTLTALAQLTATRMGVGRACISLIDGEYQHYIAEATPTIALRPDPGTADEALWVGTASIPRSWGVCEQILELGDDVALVVNDLSECDRYAHHSFVKGGPQWRFYAGAPLISPRGSVVGAVSIWDAQARPGAGMPSEEITLLQDFAATIVKYLDTYTIRDQYQRGEQFTRGLLSFAQGASALRPYKVFADDTSNQSGSTAGSACHSLQGSSSFGSRTIQAISSSNERSIGTLQNSILPPHSRDMFSRAANVMMASSNLDGVLIVDASVAATDHRQFPGNNYDENAGDSHPNSSSSDDGGGTLDSGHEMTEARTPKKCSMLGYAIQRKQSETGPPFGTLLERDLARLLKEWPIGKIVNFTATGASVSSTDDTSSSNASSKEDARSEPKRKDQDPKFRSSTAIHEMIPSARSVAFVPFWDYERSRWFAGCLCWSNSPQRLLSASVDLNYFKIFSDSIMRELSRLDALASHEQKTTFVASISHELRSPLHGILGTLEFIKDTPLDSFQVSMLNSLHSCGQTLLDTINQVMDYTKSNEAGKTVSSRKLRNTNTIRLSSKPLKTRKIKENAFDLSTATEEVVEAVFSGSLYVPIIGNEEGVSSPSETEHDTRLKAEPSSDRKMCYIVLDIAHESDWVRCFPVGAWKRIVMNLFGNAVKYTQSGHIHVSLRTNPSRESDNTTTVTLSIKDSGSGMSPGFLANRAFQPFSQENPHSTGVGLGLSIVRQLIETSGGKIEVSSEPSVGTNFTVKLSLTKPELPLTPAIRQNDFFSAVSRLTGRRVCILHKKYVSPSESSESFGNNAGLSRFTDALANTLATHLKMEVIQTEDWSGHDADLVIYPEPSFEYLDAIRRWRVDNKPAPITVFVAMDTLEASTFRSDIRVQNEESVVEIITQPCGPYKLATTLNKCINRYENRSENFPSLTTSDQPSSCPNLETIETQEQVFYPIQKRHEIHLSTSSTPIEVTDSAPQFPAAELDGRKSMVTTSILPLVSSPPADPKDVLPIRAKSSVLHVLVTDDNAINRKLLIAFLKKQKLAYSEAENGLEAQQSYQNQSIRYDVILMDMSMPVMDGMSATRAIRQYEQTYNVPRCCIIALTGLASNSARLEAWNSGIDQYMIKPVSFTKLAEILEEEKVRKASVEDAKHAEKMRKVSAEEAKNPAPCHRVNVQHSGIA